MVGMDGTTIVCAADALYFDLLRDLVSSLRAHPVGCDISLSILDVGLDPAQRQWAESEATVVTPDQDFNFRGQDKTPRHFSALLARPYLRRYFPGFDVYVQLDCDAWVQRWEAIEAYVREARAGKLAITVQLDRAYNTAYKRPRRLGQTQNYRCFRWSYGWRVADRLGRNPILNAGVFALAADAPHWDLWAAAIERAFSRRTLWPRSGWPDLPFKLVEQTALNYVVFGDKAPTALLPAPYNWMCCHAVPMLDRATGLLVESEAPHQPLGIIHFAGEGFQDRVYSLKTADGHEIETRLRYTDIQRIKKALAGKTAT